MKVTPVQTPKVLAGSISLLELIDQALATLKDRSIVVITSKVVALCESRIVPLTGTDRQQLIQTEADWYYTPQVPADGYNYNLTIKQNTLIPASGIDESNGNGSYVLWPKDPTAAARAVRRHLLERFKLTAVGVIITDSTIGLSRWGTLGIAIGHSGFTAVRDYVGQADLFGRPLLLSKANVAGGLAAAAVTVMGEGAEQTPLAVIEDLPAATVEFHSRDCTPEELAAYYVSPLDDEPFKPFFASAEWQRTEQIDKS